MGTENRRVLVVSRDAKRYQPWLGVIEASGREALRVDSPAEAVAGISEFKPALMFIDVLPEEHVEDFDEDFVQQCRDAGLAVVPILVNPTPKDVADSFRRGAIDVLIEPFASVDLLNTLVRVGSFRNLYSENRTYRTQLEHANRELRDSLNTLKMDQLAGREVQLSILPDRPLVYGDYEIAHKIIPSLYLSGDFVGYNVLLDRFLIFWVADVSGHGASSAFITVMLSFMMRQVSRRYTGTQDDIDTLMKAPQGLLENINRHVLAMDVDKHLTLFVGSVDMQRNTLRYATGAQLPLPVLASETGAKYLPGTGKPLGLIEDSTWAVREMVLPDSFSLSIVSDGMLDCLSGDNISEKEEALLRACDEAEKTHEGIAAALHVDDISEAPDDVSLLTVVKKASHGQR